MGIVELFLIAVGLSMDAFAVAVCKGLAMQNVTARKAGTVGLWFGGFQALMPAIGYILGSQFADYIVAIDHWIAFVLLAIIGGNMIHESLEQECPECEGDDSESESHGDSLAPKEMLVMAVATSIDALAVGITLAFLNVNIIAAVLFIGIITFTLSTLGVEIGNVFGSRFKSKAEFAGGLILILIGLKILLEHLGILVL